MKPQHLFFIYFSYYLGIQCEFDIIEEEPDFNAAEENDDDYYQPETDHNTDTGTETGTDTEESASVKHPR